MFIRISATSASKKSSATRGGISTILSHSESLALMHLLTLFPSVVSAIGSKPKATMALSAKRAAKSKSRGASKAKKARSSKADLSINRAYRAYTGTSPKLTHSQAVSEGMKRWHAKRRAALKAKNR